MDVDRTPIVAVVGPGAPDGTDVLDAARAVGAAIADARAILLCGGLGGVMEAACEGARTRGGITVGLLPGADRAAANRHVVVALATGLGELRNGLVVRGADAVIAIGRGLGTLSEVALALRGGTPVVGIGTWDVPGVVVATDPADAVSVALAPLRTTGQGGC